MFRNHTPKRTHKKSYKSHRTYKKYLEKDFIQRCGYCNGLISWLGGRRAFHVDHFVPWKKFKDSHPYLKLDYNNLVFSCPYCNTYKSEKWPTNDPSLHNDGHDGFIDPCCQTYNASFTRNRYGEILPLNSVAEYMYKNLCLGLKRHKINWQLEELINIKKELSIRIEKVKKEELKLLLKEYRAKVNKEISDVIEIFRDLELK